MFFNDALKALKDGKKIKLPTWLGYWAMEDKYIKMHTKEGSVIVATYHSTTKVLSVESVVDFLEDMIFNYIA